MFDVRSSFAHRAPLAVFAVALALYAGSAAWFEYPNEWLPAIVSLMGLDPFQPLSHPLWQALVMALDRVPGVNTPVAANLLGAVCGAASIALVHSMAGHVRILPSGSPAQPANAPDPTAPSRRVAAWVSALYAAACLPMILVSTRAHPLALDALLLLAAVWLAQEYIRSRRLRAWRLFCLLYGLGCAEFPTFYLVAPLFGIAWAWWLIRDRRLTRGTLLSGFGLFCVGYATILLFCWAYYQSPVAAWREFGGFTTVVYSFFLEQYRALLYSVPPFGWLLIFLLMIGPSLVFFTQSLDSAADPYTKLGVNAFRVALTGMALLPLFNGVGSPWRIAGPTGLMITPYLCVAFWFGRLVALLHWDLGLARPDRRGRPAPAKRFGQPALLASVVLVLATAGALNARIANVAHARPIVAFADEILASMNDRTWLLSDGSFDALLRLRARAAGRELRLLHGPSDRSPAYLRYVATLLPDAPRRSAVASGLQPMLDVWHAQGTLHEELAVLDNPGVWTQRGMAYRIDGVLYAGAPGGAGDQGGDLRESLAALAQYTNRFSAFLPPPAVEARYYARIARHLSMLANNLGVALDDAGHPADAWNAYLLARSFLPDQASALLNLQAMAEREGRPENDALKEEIARMTQKDPSRFAPSRLVAAFGYVRHPMAYAREGMDMAYGGRPDLGADRIRQAMALSQTQPTLQFLLARLLQEAAGEKQSVRIYVDLLKRDPSNVQALAALARLLLEHGQYDRASKLIDRLMKLAPGDHAFAVERALLLAAEGRREEARALLLASAREDRTRAPVWLALALMAMEDADPEAIEEPLAELRRARSYVPGLIFLADHALGNSDPAAAREHLERAAQLARRNTDVLEKLVALDFLEGQWEAAGKGARDLMNLDADNATANYVIGILQHRQGQRDLAEASLRRAVNTRPTGPACNDLAWMLQERGEMDEALDLSKKAVDLMPGQSVYWSNHAYILGRLDRWPDSARAFDEAMRRGLNQPDGLLGAATAYLQTGQGFKARQILDSLESQASSLPPSSSNRYASLKAALP